MQARGEAIRRSVLIDCAVRIDSVMSGGTDVTDDSQWAREPKKAVHNGS